jgi:hypothetical protein
MRFGSRRSLYSSSSGFDESALAYFEAAGISNQAERQAVNRFFIQLKQAGFWDQIIRIYLFSSTSLEAASYCAKTLTTGTFVNSPSLSSLGVLFDGASNYFVLPDTINLWLGPSVNNLSVSIYQNKTLGLSDPSNVWLGAGLFNNSGQISIVRLGTTRNLNGRIGTITATTEIADQQTGVGFYVLNRTNSTTQTIYKNGSLEDTKSLSSSPLTASQIAFGCRYNSSSGTPATSLSDIQVGLGVFSTAIGASDQANYNSIVSDFLSNIDRLV